MRLVTFLPSATIANIFDKAISPLATNQLGNPEWLMATGVMPAPEGAPV